MAAIVHSDKAKKAIKKIKEAMQDYPLGIEFGELMQKTGYAKSSLYSALSLVGAQKSDDGLWHLLGSQNFVAPVNETAEDDLDDLATAIDQPVKQDDGGNMQDDGGNTQDAPVNMQDEELNTQDPHVSYHDNESSSPDNDEANLINPSAEIFNPSAGVANPSDIDTDADQQDTTEVGQIIVSSDDLHPEFAQLPDYQSSNSQEIETASQGLAAELKQLDNAYLDGLASKAEAPNAEVGQATVKHYLLIENCTLSLAQDGTGQEPVLAKDFWVDDEGIELKDSDCQVMKRARMPFINEVEFRGVTYRNLFIVNNAQIFHGVFDSIKTAHDKMAELTAKKRGNFFEVIEV